MLILEGCDGTGKTTLARMMSDRYDIFGVRQSPGSDAKLSGTDLFRALTEYTKDPDCPRWVYDRFFWSEMVYGTVLRGRISLTGHQMALIDDYWSETGPLFVLCRPPFETVRDNLNASAASQMEGVIYNAKDIYDLYDLFIGMREDCIVWDYTSSEAEQNDFWNITDQYMALKGNTKKVLTV